ncbi:MAG: Ig-like domain-containing protein [Lachnospiraceae bacterium]|nr:Ig-like domain-containing protein [Lachnospiraceae bacterium]
MSWTSSNKEVATVSQKGVVKAKGIGIAIITASHNGKKYNCKVTVKEKNKVNAEYIYAYVGDKELKIKLADNSSATALAEYLSDGDVTIKMSDYGNFEKVGDLGTTLPRNDEDITTEAGDVILYMGNKITIYYDTNSWDFTRLGKVQGFSQSELKDILGDGDVKIRFSLK